MEQNTTEDNDKGEAKLNNKQTVELKKEIQRITCLAYTILGWKINYRNLFLVKKYFLTKIE